MLVMKAATNPGDTRQKQVYTVQAFESCACAERGYSEHEERGYRVSIRKGAVMSIFYLIYLAATGKF